MGADQRDESDGDDGHHHRASSVVKNEDILLSYMSNCRGDAYRTACLPQFGRILPSQLLQAQGLHWDAWSFGATLFALAFGQAPIAPTASSEDNSDHPTADHPDKENGATTRTADGSSSGKKGGSRAATVHGPATAASLLLRLMTLTPLLSEDRTTTTDGHTDDVGAVAGEGLLPPAQKATLKRLSALKGHYLHILQMHPTNTPYH